MNGFQFVLNILDSDAVLGKEVVFTQVVVSDIVDSILNFGICAHTFGYAVANVEVEFVNTVFQVGDVILDIDNGSAIFR